jgi:hypothetical protein
MLTLIAALELEIRLRKLCLCFDPESPDRRHSAA